jgi:hypothetical protein
MYAVTSFPLLKRTRATFRSAEFGFLGVEANAALLRTLVQVAHLGFLLHLGAALANQLINRWH